MSSLWRQSLESWLKTIEVSGSVLDVGGAQKPVKGRTKTWDVDKYGIVDKEDYGLNKEYWNVFVETIDYPDAIFAEQFRFDNVFLLETLMYSFNPYQALVNTMMCVNPGGNLYISNPLEGYGETKPEGTDMNRMFPNWFERMLTNYDIKEMNIVEPYNPLPFGQARQSEGYKMIRPHASGILIHAVKT